MNENEPQIQQENNIIAQLQIQQKTKIKNIKIINYSYDNAFKSLGLKTH